MSVCQCDGPGWCAARDCHVSAMGHRICRSGNERSIRRYFEPAHAESAEPPAEEEPVEADWLAEAVGKGKRLTKAAMRWIKAGRPMATPEEQAERLAICQGGGGHAPCPKYDAAAGKCKACGCGLKKGVGIVPAKSKMATEECPAGKWPRIWPRGGVAEMARVDSPEAIAVAAGATPLPKTMKAPGDRRDTWRGGIIQIMVGRACDLACHHCTQGSNLGMKPAMVTEDDFEKACDSLQGYPGVVGMFGGNPALHPKFEAFCEILRGKFPWEQRGLWCNHPRGKGAVARITFNPAHSNLNCHLASEAHAEFSRDWPESIPYLKGMDTDSVHSSPWVAMKDVVADEEERWKLIGGCDVNQHWSALVGVVPGRGLRAYFCEIAYAQAALHATAADAGDWPDTGLPAEPGWWRKPMAEFDAQVRLHCHACGIPLRRQGQLAIGGEFEEFSQTHWALTRTKVKDRPIQIVELSMLAARPDRPATQYLPGTTPGYRGS